jgi:hypothetical protein
MEKRDLEMEFRVIYICQCFLNIKLIRRLTET